MNEWLCYANRHRRSCRMQVPGWCVTICVCFLPCYHFTYCTRCSGTSSKMCRWPHEKTSGRPVRLLLVTRDEGDICKVSRTVTVTFSVPARRRYVFEFPQYGYLDPPTMHLTRLYLLNVHVCKRVHRPKRSTQHIPQMKSRGPPRRL